MILLRYGEHLPYLNELTRIFRNEDSLLSINSFEYRVFMWENALQRLDGLSWIFGFGAGSMTVLDNDYLYAVFNYGLFGTAINVLMYGFIYYCFSKLEDRRFSVLGRQYIIFSFIIGLQVETLNGWNYPILIMFLAGIAFALHKKNRI